MSKKRNNQAMLENKAIPILAVFLMFVLVNFWAGCDNNTSVSVPISQKAVAVKKKFKKTISESLKAKQIHPRKLSAKKTTTSPTMIIGSEKKGGKKIKKIHYVSKIDKLRDPFVPFIRFAEKTAKRKIKGPLSPLQKYSLSQLTLIAIIDAGKNGRWAMVRDSSGKGFTIREGVRLGSEGGIVRKILPDRIVVEKTTVDLLGKKRITMITLKLHPEKKGE